MKGGERRDGVEKTESEEECLRADDRQREGARNEEGSWRARQGEVSQTQPAGQTDRGLEKRGLTERQKAREAGRVRGKTETTNGSQLPTHCLLNFHLWFKGNLSSPKGSVGRPGWR